VEGLSKSFAVYERRRDLLLELLRGRARHKEAWALRDVSFEVQGGEVLGIVGRNGAGKSTLLRILAGTLNKSAGSVALKGRVGAILELGAGFHPDYSGRENVFMGGLCLGLTRAEVERKAQEIIAFSGLGDAIDQPLRTYSTGMQARLTFSTAVSVDPDILIIDEALSVGDAQFQLKCFRRIREFRERGKTILLVSHDSNAVLGFCDRALVLEKGRVYAQGSPHEMVKAYHELIFGSDAANELGPVAPRLAQRQGDGSVELVDFGIVDASGKKTTLVESGARYRLTLRFRSKRDLASVSCGFNVMNARGVLLYGVTSLSQHLEVAHVEEGETVECVAEVGMWLAAGDYFISLGVADPETGMRCDYIEDALQFRVLGPPGIFTTSTVNLDTKFSVERRQGSP
jgi:ABC-type polysaccharide/polyol phosphate transport system ATPase subunit